jgi:hypothetical protein
MARQHMPERLENVGEPPRTPSGTVQKLRLRETARAFGTPTGPKRWQRMPGGEAEDRSDQRIPYGARASRGLPTTRPRNAARRRGTDPSMLN